MCWERQAKMLLLLLILATVLRWKRLMRRRGKAKSKNVIDTFTVVTRQSRICSRYISVYTKHTPLYLIF